MNETPKLKVRKACAGVYYYWLDGQPEREVCVNKIDGNPEYGDPAYMWMAAVQWRNDGYTDPVETKREAVASVMEFLTSEHFK